MKFVHIARYRFIVEPRYYFYGWSKSPKVFARQSVARALLRAKRQLPNGYNFKIWDAQRPRKVQLAMLKSFKKRLRLMHPRFSPKKILQLLVRFGGPVPPPRRIRRLDTHRNGGAFDLTIVDRNGKELFMGTDHDDVTPRAATDYFEKKRRLTFFEKEARKNRRLLKRVMTTAGFKNYASEWWHWSFEK